ncbi:MAG: eukaryotic-like serine/threonine-protein kinase [Acidimicrobiaceae bacterium]|nr:eukaryotic-like serine/threonine-protein kinase [Acidimicrobiaceae bacterium]
MSAASTRESRRSASDLSSFRSIQGDHDDATLVSAAQAGDRGALDTLLRRHHDRLFALCRRIMGNHSDALDATQEALIALVRGLPRFDGRAAFTTWSYRVATNTCMDELRRRRRRPDPAEPDDDHHASDADLSAPSVDEQIVARLSLDEAMQRLPPEFRAAVVLRDVCTLDYAEIAEVLDIPPGTVRSRIARGRALLAGHIGGNPSPSSERQTPLT